MEKQPTIDTCVLSGRPIRQSHLDDGLVMSYGKGKAFVSAVENTVKEPPINPVVFSAQDVSVVSLTYTKYNFPERYDIKGKAYKSLPKFIYVQNQHFKLHSLKVVQNLGMDFGDTQDGMVLTGIAIYKRTSERPEVTGPKEKDSEPPSLEEAIESTSKKYKNTFEKLAEEVDKPQKK